MISKVFLGLILLSTVLSAAIRDDTSSWDYTTPVSTGSLIDTQDSVFTANVLTSHNSSSNLSVIVGNDKFTLHMGPKYGTELMWQDTPEDDPVDLIGIGVGLYTSYTNKKEIQVNYSSVNIVDIDNQKMHLCFYAWEGELHLILFRGLNGIYSYFLNHNLPVLGEFRTLIRLNPDIYQDGHTSLKDEPLPKFPQDYVLEEIFDETWIDPNNQSKYITKYDWSTRLHEEELYGVHGEYNGKTYGFWLISPGRDYYCGDQIKQELMVHRESKTGDVVLLNMLHGTHFEAASSEAFPKDKLWGPYLWYFNDGSVSDANRRLLKERRNWPYRWLDDPEYLNRGKLQGRLLLPDGSPAASMNLFLGYTDNYTMVQGSGYQYYSYTDDNGYFSISDVRVDQDYYLQAFPSEWTGKDTPSGDVVGHFLLPHAIKVQPEKVTDLGDIQWQQKLPDSTASNPKGHETIWQIGSYDRTTKGFKYAADTYRDFQTEMCPGDYDFYVGKTSDRDFCYAKSKAGAWNIHFELPELKENTDASLYISLAGFTGLYESFVGGNSTRLQVEVNGNRLDRDVYNTTLMNDKSTYRSTSFAGNWFYSRLVVPHDYLMEGENNVALVTTNYTENYGIMWDSLKLAWDY